MSNIKMHMLDGRKVGSKELVSDWIWQHWGKENV